MHTDKPVAPVIQLVTPKTSDVGTCVRIPVQSHELGFFLPKKNAQQVETDYFVRVHKVRLHDRRGKGMAESFSAEKLRQAPQKKDG